MANELVLTQTPKPRRINSLHRVYERPTDNRERRWAPVPVKCPKNSDNNYAPISLTAKKRAEARLKAEIEKHKNDLSYSNVTMKDTGVYQTLIFFGLCLSLTFGSLLVFNLDFTGIAYENKLFVFRPVMWDAALFLLLFGNLFLAAALTFVISDKRDLLFFCSTLLVLGLFVVLEILGGFYYPAPAFIAETMITIVYLLYVLFFYRNRFGALAAIDVFSVWFALLMHFSFVF